MNALHYRIFCQASNPPSHNLPPIRDALEKYTRWANYQTTIWQEALAKDPVAVPKARVVESKKGISLQRTAPVAKAKLSACQCKATCYTICCQHASAKPPAIPSVVSMPVQSHLLYHLLSACQCKATCYTICCQHASAKPPAIPSVVSMPVQSHLLYHLLSACQCKATCYTICCQHASAKPPAIPSVVLAKITDWHVELTYANG